jgi:hypothetical protein
MKNWKQIFEHHDEEWPEEVLAMTIDQLLDKLKSMGLDSEYETIESILKSHMMNDMEQEMPTWDEFKNAESGEFDTIMNKASWMDSLDF